MERQGDDNNYDTSGDGLASFCTCFYLIATAVNISANQQSVERSANGLHIAIHGTLFPISHHYRACHNWRAKAIG